MADETVTRSVPRDPLDLNLMLTDTLYGSKSIDPEFRDGIARKYALIGDDGQPLKNDRGEIIVQQEAGWEMLQYFTRDLRLGFINDAQMRACQHWLDLAGDCLHEKYMGAFLTAYRKAVSIIELSQSHKGQLRKNATTYRQESTTRNVPEKKQIMPGGN